MDNRSHVMYKAAMNGDWNIINEKIKEGVDVNYADNAWVFFVFS
jgi:hypothetical protein